MENQYDYDQEPDVTEEEYWFNDFDESKKILLYVYKKNKEGKFASTFRYDSEERPDEHDIGMKFGSGDYKVVARQGNKTKTKYFSCGEFYDTVVRDDVEEKQEVPLSGGGDIASQITTGLLKGLTDLATPFIPIVIQAVTKPKQDTPFNEILAGAYSSASAVMEDGLKKQSTAMSQTLRELTKEITGSMKSVLGAGRDNEYEEVIEEEESNSMLKNPMVAMAWQMIKPQIPAIIEGAGEELVATAKANPLFQSLVQNETAVREIQSLILNEFGVDALNVINNVVFVEEV